MSLGRSEKSETEYDMNTSFFSIENKMLKNLGKSKIRL